MPINLGDQFRGLPMGDLIGGPLMAAADAQVRLANATANFIQQVGFMPTEPCPSSDPARIGERTVAFRFDRAQAGAQPDPVTGNVPTETVELDVPLLAIVKVVPLGIDTVGVTFDMEIAEGATGGSDGKGPYAPDGGVGWGPFSLKAHVEGSVGADGEHAPSTGQAAKYHVEVDPMDKGMPEGLARVLDMMNAASAPVPIGTSGPPLGGNGALPPRDG